MNFIYKNILFFICIALGLSFQSIFGIDKIDSTFNYVVYDKVLFEYFNFKISIMKLLASLYLAISIKNGSFSTLIERETFRKGIIFAASNYLILSRVCLIISKIAEYLRSELNLSMLPQAFILMAAGRCATSLPPFAHILGAKSIETFSGVVCCYILSIILFRGISYLFLKDTTVEVLMNGFSNMATILVLIVFMKSLVAKLPVDSNQISLIAKGILILINIQFFSKLVMFIDFFKNWKSLTGLLLLISILYFRIYTFGILIEKYLLPRDLSHSDRVNTTLFLTLKSDTIAIILSESLFTDPIVKNGVVLVVISAQIVQTFVLAEYEKYFSPETKL